MNKAIHFKTSIFDPSKEEKNPINQIYGHSLIDWLIEKLKERFEIDKPEAEDWGWYSYIEWEGRNYLIGACAYYEEGEDPTKELEWVFQVDKIRTFKESLLGREKLTIDDPCFKFFKSLFENEPNINSVEIG